MDEQALRQQVCQAAQQLWLRRLICGEAGVISAEINRRRYVVTPAEERRADMSSAQLLCVDLEGQNVAGGSTSLPSGYWAAHHVAYQTGFDLARPGHESARPPIHATVLATPPNVMALHKLDPKADRLEIAGSPDLRVVEFDQDDEQPLAAALEQVTCVLLAGQGVFAADRSLAACLNQIESLEHHGSIDLATRGA